MTKLLILAAALAACTQQQDGTALHSLGDTTLELVSLGGQVNVEMKVAGDGCTLLADDVSATFDGQPMEVSRGGYAETSDGCYPIAFWLRPDQVSAITTYEQGVSGSSILIQDKSAVWTVGSTRLFGNQFVNDVASSRIIWQDVTQITTATLDPVVPITITGNAISYPAGTDILSVSAYAHPKTMQCDGPGLCTVDLRGAHDFTHVQPN